MDRRRRRRHQYHRSCHYHNNNHHQHYVSFTVPEQEVCLGVSGSVPSSAVTERNMYRETTMSRLSHA